MDAGLYAMKVFHIFFDVVIWMFGLAIVGIGLWLVTDGDDFKYFRAGMDVEYIYKACIVLIVAGLIAMAMSLIGCLGVANENGCLIKTFTVFLILTIILEFIVAGLVWHNASDIKEWIYDQVHGRVTNYYVGSEEDAKMIDFMQFYLECCGANSFKDYDKTKLPNSCKDSITGVASSYGCLELGEYFFERKAALFGGMALGMSFIQLFALANNIFLICFFRRRK